MGVGKRQRAHGATPPRTAEKSENNNELERETADGGGKKRTARENGDGHEREDRGRERKDGK
jgi:hypothetical protein